MPGSESRANTAMAMNAEQAGVILKTAGQDGEFGITLARLPGPERGPTTLTPAAPVLSQVPASSGGDIRDIRQPRHLPTPLPWVAVAAGVILFGAAAFAARRCTRAPGPLCSRPWLNPPAPNLKGGKPGTGSAAGDSAIPSHQAADARGQSVAA